MGIYNRCNQYLLLALAAAAPSLAFATNGQVNFTGSINDSACAVDVDGAGSSIGGVDLGHLGAGSFSPAVGDASTKVGFTIKFSNCNSSALGNAKIVFGGTKDPVNNTLLALTSDATKGYAIGLYDKNKNPLAINTFSPGEAVTSGSTPEAFFQFYANYVTTAIASNRASGPGNASTTFSVSYQ